jgi:hypothetical protein
VEQRDYKSYTRWPILGQPNRPEVYGELGHSRPTVDKIRVNENQRHHHFVATVTYEDGKTFSRRYVDLKTAEIFIRRQKKLSIVKSGKIESLD